MVDRRFDTPEMLMSEMDRGQHVADPLRRLLSFGAMAGNDDIVVIDMSYWQDHNLIDYDKLSKVIDGCILRATYGIWKDTRVDIHFEELHSRGVPIGFYGYLIGNHTGTSQANAFYSAVSGKEWKLRNWADIEDRRPGTYMNRLVAESFMRDVDAKFKLRTEIYTGVFAWNDIMKGGGHAHRRLWIANYQVNSPRLPINGDWKDWFMWQHTDRGRLDGYNRSLDLNRVNVSREIWNSFAGIEITEPDPEPPVELPWKENMEREIKDIKQRLDVLEKR